MKQSGWIVAVLAGILPCTCLAGPKKDPPLLAAADLPTIVTFDMRPATAPAAEADNHTEANTHTAEATTSAAEMDLLPDAPEIPQPTFSAKVEPTAPARRLSLSRRQFTPAVSPLYSVPVVNSAMRLGGHHFNTTDGSSLNAFAICYRLNRRSSVQVIPGDPAPVKLPVATLANNTGVTVGMVYRLSRRR